MGRRLTEEQRRARDEKLARKRAKNNAHYMPMPSGIHFWRKRADGLWEECDEGSHDCMTIGGPLGQLVDFIKERKPAA